MEVIAYSTARPTEPDAIDVEVLVHGPDFTLDAVLRHVGQWAKAGLEWDRVEGVLLEVCEAMEGHVYTVRIRPMRRVDAPVEAHGSTGLVIPGFRPGQFA